VTEAKHRAPAVHAGARRLIEIMLTEPGLAFADAAGKAGLTVRSARVYLGRPHVIAHYRAEKRRLVEELALANPQALAQIRDTAENTMSRVQAARSLEQMRVEAVQESGGEHRQRPGLQIVIHMPGGEQRIVSGPQQPALPLQIEGEGEGEGEEVYHSREADHHEQR
jgi:hypothetical protein